MSEKTRGKFSFPAWMGIGAVWFGVHVGPGTASGRQGATYYGAYGKWGFIVPLVAMMILGIAIYYTLEHSRRNNLNNYNDFFNSFFAPHEKPFSIWFDIVYFGTYFMSCGAAVATGSAILTDAFKWNHWASLFIVVVVCVLLIFFGSEVIKNASTIMTYGMLTVLVLLLIFALRSPAAHFSDNWATIKLSDNSLGLALWSAVIYASFQCTGAIGSCASLADGLKSRKDSIKAAVFGIATNTALLIMITALQFGFLPQALKEGLPNLYAINQINIGWLYWLYVVFVELAVVSTAIGFTYGVVTRIQKYVHIKSQGVKSVVLNLGFLLGAAVVSLAGLTAIVNVGFKYLGYACLPFVIVPIYIIGYKSITRGKKPELKSGNNYSA